ncbi:MAG: AbrB/MazE/SpoVT family DNA-binding domain-containing protein [Candidatus Woesearchaeota archaeon]|jgi:antitoxin component of MazEF toxin-antitoxin module
MKRKVTKMGNSSLVVTLPNSWVKENKVEKGDELNVEAIEKNLIISTTNIRKKDSLIQVDVSTFSNRTIQNILNYAYRSGYCTIKLKFKEERQFNQIVEVVRNTLLGFELIEERNNICTIQNVAEPSPDHVEVMIRKAFLMMKQLGELVLNEPQSELGKSLSRVKSTRETIDNLTNFIRREIISINYGGKERSYFLWSIISELSLAAHAYCYFYQQKKTNESEKLKKLLMKNNTMLELLYNTFYNHNYATIDKIYQLREEIETEILKNANKLDSGAFLIFELSRHLQLCSSLLIGAHINSKNEKSV